MRFEAMNSNISWKVSLNNGESFQEKQKPFDIIPGELSPWKRLEKYVQDNNLAITSCALFYKDKLYNLHSTGGSPRFQRFSLVEKPIKYRVERVLGTDISPQNKVLSTELFTIAIAEYKNYDLELWVSDKNPSNSWSLVKEK